MNKWRGGAASKEPVGDQRPHGGSGGRAGPGWAEEATEACTAEEESSGRVSSSEATPEWGTEQK